MPSKTSDVQSTRRAPRALTSVATPLVGNHERGVCGLDVRMAAPGAHVQWPSFPRGTCTPGGKTAAFLFFGTGPHDAPAHASNGTCDECMHLRHRVGARHRRVGGKSRDRAARAAASPDGRQSDSVTSRSFTPCRAIWCLWPSFTIVTRDRLVGSKVVYECILTTLTSHLYLTSVLQHAKPLTQRR